MSEQQSLWDRQNQVPILPLALLWLKFPAVRPSLSCSQLSPQHPGQRLAHSRCSVMFKG